MNHLYFGDCLDVLRDLKENFPQPFIDLIYIDPPFNSKRNYNVLFESMDMKDANAQKQAFADTWTNVAYMDELQMLAEMHKDLYDVLTAFGKAKSISHSAVAYLTTMALRILYMHKLLKDTGSFYLHCDPTMSHYLKLICDMIFGEKNYQNEIVWQRVNAKGNVQRKFGAVHDVIFRYSKKPGDDIWNQLYIPLSQYYMDTSYRNIEEGTGRKFMLDNLTAPMTRASKGQIYEWRGVRPPSSRCCLYRFFLQALLRWQRLPESHEF
jgi:adenine specific DNA methylase Mod